MTEGIDKAGNLHGVDGQFISIGTLFERERQEHGRDHEQERLIARDTAQRLEREVEKTARHLERMVEETAVRLEKAVAVALQAVATTADIHSEAHNKEHVAHERIHSVEKTQVEKAEVQQRDQAERIATALSEYKMASNEWRAALGDQSGKFVSRELFDSELQPLKDFKAKALGFGALGALIVGLAGGFIGKGIG